MDSKRWVMRWWPLLYSIIWIIWAVLAPEPHFADSNLLGHTLAALGAVGLFAMGLWPSMMYVRFFGTLLAITYPLHRSLAIASDNENIPDLSRRIVATSFSITVVLSLLLLYPSLWWVSHRKDLENGD